jgi:organic hydroperoxide reductase OsmC/OhrA
MPTHTFRARLIWQSGASGTAWGNHRVEFDGKPPIEVSAAPQYRGDATKTNPEELLLASVASCQMLTYLALASRQKIDLLSYEDRPEATLAIADRRMRVTEIVLRPRIVLAPGSDPEKARSLVESAHEGCFIANSVSCAVRVEPEIVAGER